MNNKKLLQQILKIDSKSDIGHIHDEYLELSDLPQGGYVAIDVKEREWSLGEDGLYTAVVRHQLGTTTIMVEAVSSEGSLLVIGYDAKGENIVELISEEAIDMTVAIIHRAEAHTAVGYNPINDEVINNFQTWSSEKVNNTIREITGAVDMSHLATKTEVQDIEIALNRTIATKAESTHRHSISDIDNLSLDWTAIENKPNVATKEEVAHDMETKADKQGSNSQDFNAKNLVVSGAILPSKDGLDIGSETQRFRGIYVDEAYLSTNTLYIGDTPILGTSQDTVMIKADPDQSICVKTSATGTTKVISENGVEVSTSGMNANVVLQATGVNSQVNIASTGTTTVSAEMFQINSDTTNAKNLNVNGNLVVNGDKSTLQCRAVEIKDNMLDINFGETGNGVTSKVAGLRIVRGEEDPFLLLFDETDDKLKVGFSTSSMKPLALSEEVTNAVRELTSYTDNAIGDLMGTAPEALNTLQELAEALGNDSNFATTITTKIGEKAATTYVNSELAKKADLTTVNNELSKKADVGHNHDDRYFTKDEINAMMANMVTFEPVNTAYAIKTRQEEAPVELCIEELLAELQAEREARKALEERLTSLEKAITKEKTSKKSK